MLRSCAVSPQVTEAINPAVGWLSVVVLSAGTAAAFPAGRTSPPFARYQIILLDDGGTCMSVNKLPTVDHSCKSDATPPLHF